MRNYSELIENASSRAEKESRRICLDSLDSALRSAEPRRLMRKKIRVVGEDLAIAGTTVNLSKFRRIVVIGGGKAAAPMARMVESLLGDRIADGTVNVPQTQAGSRRDGAIVKLHPATHPLPSQQGVDGVMKMLEVVGKPSRETLVICLISGGGSALMPLPSRKVSLSDKLEVTRLLLRAGATIRELNVVRKHLSELKGGWLARKIHPCTSLVLVISDVVGDSLDSIASGPLYPDVSTFSDALLVLKKYTLEGKVPHNILKTLKDGDAGRVPETPKPNDRCFARVRHFIVGNNMDACEGAYLRLRSLRRRPLFLTSSLEGEARYAGAFVSSVAKSMLTGARLGGRFASLVAGGETTVAVTGSGKGGRNQEAALAAAISLDGLEGVTVAFIGTDGRDGPTDAAGAMVDGSTLRRGLSNGLDASEYLLRNDSYNFFRKIGDLVVTGPTGTNVNDLSVAVCRSI